MRRGRGRCEKKAKAEEITRKVSGVKSVVNNLEVNLLIIRNCTALLFPSKRRGFQREFAFSMTFLQNCVIALEMNSRIILWLVFLIFLFSGTAFGAEDAAKARQIKAEEKPWVRRVSFGVVLHDTGPISDNKENGVDPNWEVQFNRPDWTWWRWLGSPYPSIGVTPSFTGETSEFYFGIFNYEFSLSNKFLDDLTNNFTKNLWFQPG